MANYYGIDFGTTNSAVYSISAFDDQIVDEFSIGENDRRPLPSYVAIHKETGEIVTGLDAKNSILEDAGEYKVFSSIKTIVDMDIEWNIAGKIWRPVDVVAELFKALKEKVIRRTKEELKKAVIAVPIGFSSKKKNVIREAAVIAGIEVILFVSEPTAAFCSRKDEMKKYKNVAVFDWGGGTLDVAVLRIENNVVNELSTVGITMAGNDIDRIIAERICLNASRKNKIDFSFSDLSQEVQQRLLQKCETAKCNLADEDIVTITDTKLDNFGMLFEKIEYDYFSLLIEKEVEQAVECLLKALSEAGMNRESIDCILCEGGSSRLRPLQSALRRYFDQSKLIFPRKAMWDIAAGVAKIAYSPGCYRLTRPIGILQANNIFYPLLKAGQRVPTEKKIVKLGLTESPGEARFVFTDGVDERNQTFLEHFPVKLRGFDDEFIEIECYIDADMVFKIKIYSNRMPKDVFRVWTYSNLKVSYEIDKPHSKYISQKKGR